MYFYGGPSNKGGSVAEWLAPRTAKNPASAPEPYAQQSSMDYLYLLTGNEITSGSTELGNNLPGIDDNVRERGLEQKCFQTLTEGRQRRSREHIVRQTVPKIVGPATGKALPPTV